MIPLRKMSEKGVPIHSGDYFQGLFIVVDIDSTDVRYELLIGEESPSSDAEGIGYIKETLAVIGN